MTATPSRLAGKAYANSVFLDLGGVRTHVQTWAPDGAATATVVGLHHFYGSAQTYHRLGPRLAAAGLRLVAFDRVGFGLTERPRPAGRWTGADSPYTRAFAVRQVAALLDHLEVEQAVVTGTSMGGAITLEFALAHPDRVRHAVPCSAPLTGDASAPAWLRPLLRRTPGLDRGGAAVVRRLATTVDHARVGRSWHDPRAVEDADVDAHARFRRAPGWDRGLWWKWVADDPPSLLVRLPELAAAGVPVTAVGATHDRLVRPGVARRIATDARGRYVELDCGHVVHAEGAAGLADVLVQAAGVA
jgi:pimeloyl-ACP methyl ester carboxylesterase